jgi:hypothetical protein
MFPQGGRRGRLIAVLYVIGISVDHIQVARATQEDLSLDLSAQVRERFESTSHPGFGLAQDSSDDYLLHRITVSARAAVGRHFYLNGELVSAGVSGAATSMSGAQVDPLDVLQFYLDGEFEADAAVRVRVGRQSLALGAARLVSTRDNTNVRRSFDGLRATWARQHLHLDGFYLRPVVPHTNVFDDTRDAGQAFWGLYLSRDAAEPGASGIDFYYLGVRNERAVFASESAGELRHTVGARLFGESLTHDWNLEAAWQWGSFGASHIRAWTLSSDVGYTLPTWPLTPRLGFKADIISGDRNSNDASLGTFNPLFPKLNYFSDAIIAVPANLCDLQPTLDITVTSSMHIDVSWNVLWKYSRDDAFYLPPLKTVAATSGSGSRYVGQQWSTTAEWKLPASTTFTAGFVSFRPGSSLRQAGGTSGEFFFASVRLDF